MNQPSPYTPGEVAQEVPGRAAQLAFYRERAKYIGLLGNFSGRITVYHAPRGLGKTSLLRGAQRIFRSNGIKTVWVTANEDENLLATLLSEMRQVLPATSKASHKVRDSLDSFTIGIGTAGTGAKATFKPSETASKAKAFQQAVIQTVAAISDDGGKGLVFLVDEIQSADKPSLRAIAHAWQELSEPEKSPPAGFFAVGLPGIQEYITDAVTFSERYQFIPLPDLDESGVAEALLEPAQDKQVTWEQDALQQATKLAQGYPYKVQLIGDESWRAAQFPEPGRAITISDVETATPEINRQMRTLFAARWRSASKKQRELISAIAELGGINVRRSQITELLGVDTGAISVPRDRLLRIGVLESTEHGQLSFTVPGFTEYVQQLNER